MCQHAPGRAPDQTVSIVVDRDNPLSHNIPVREGYDPGTRLQLRVKHKARNEAGMESANVT
jgi:hypothetical protein